MPSSATLLAALEHRFLNATLKEPALPSHLRGRATDSDLAAELVHHVRAALAEATWPHEPTVPQPVSRVFRSGAATPVEAALALKALLAQANIDSQWALVHPASSGRGGRISLAGYTHMLLEMSVPNGSLWIDPLCHDCDVFEVRPELEGSASIDPASPAPSPSPGHLSLLFEAPLAKWRLSGSAATHLRIAWAQIPMGEREAWLTHRFWPGAQLTASSGFDQPGGLITLEMSSETGSPYDPLQPPVVRTSDDTAWLPWVGTRTFTRPGSCAEASVSAGPLHWRQSHDRGTVTESLRVTARMLSGEDVRTVHRSGRDKACPYEDEVRVSR